MNAVTVYACKHAMNIALPCNTPVKPSGFQYVPSAYLFLLFLPKSAGGGGAGASPSGCGGAVASPSGGGVGAPPKQVGGPALWVDGGDVLSSALDAVAGASLGSIGVWAAVSPDAVAWALPGSLLAGAAVVCRASSTTSTCCVSADVCCAGVPSISGGLGDIKPSWLSGQYVSAGDDWTVTAFGMVSSTSHSPSWSVRARKRLY